MDLIFDQIVNVTRNVSHTCASSHHPLLDRFTHIQHTLRAVGAFWPIPWYRCSYWPVRAVERYQGPFNKTFANRVLIIGNTVRFSFPPRLLTSLINHGTVRRGDAVL